MSFSLVMSAFSTLVLVAGSVILVIRDKSWPVILLLLGSILMFCTGLLFAMQTVIGAGRTPGSLAMVGSIGLVARLLFCVGFVAYALKRERA